MRLLALILLLELSGCAMPERQLQEATDRCMQFGMDAVMYKSWWQTGFTQVECVARRDTWMERNADAR
jgi:hypothetical protein